MTEDAAPILEARTTWRFTNLAVIGLLAFYAAMSLGASLHKGPSFDEGEQLMVGYANWLYGDFRMEGANGDLTKRWATLPFLITRPHFPDTTTRFWPGAQTYELAFFFFYRDGNAPEWMLLQGRAMMLLLGVAAGLLVFVCSREIFGDFGGLISLTMFVFSPNMLAFGAHVGTAMPTFLTMLGSIWCIWHLLHRVTWRWLLASVLCLGLLFLAKPSGLAILPIAAMLVAVKLALGRPLSWALGRERLIYSRFAQFGVICGIVAVHALGSWGMIWANYDFKYAASSNPADPALIFKVQPIKDPVNPMVDDIVTAASKTHFLPQGFLEGIRLLLTTDDMRQTFMDGDWKIGGWRNFFTYALWMKSSPAFLLLVLLGLMSWWWVRDQRPAMPAEASRRAAASCSPPSYGAIPYAVLLVGYFLIATLQNLNIGHRHLLPAYPSFYVLTGVIALAWPVWRKWARLIVVILVLCRAGESVAQYPNYLAYFNPLAGGSAEGYQHLVDSSLDWGMDLPAFKEWLDRNNPDGRKRVHFAYFGTDSPRYQGISSYRLPGFPDWIQRRAFGLSPGIYAISATLYQSLYSPVFGPWNPEYERLYQYGLHNMLLFQGTANNSVQRAELLKLHPAAFWENEYSKFEKLRFARLCAWLRLNRPPDDMAAYTILIWNLDEEDLRSALFGPAPIEAPESVRSIEEEKAITMQDAD